MKRIQHETTAYRANLQRVGAAIPETIALLREYARYGDWNRVRMAALRDNLLQKGSSETVTGILRVVRRRVFLDTDTLPPAETLALAMIADFPNAAKTQLIYACICASDALVAHAVVGLVRSLLATTFEPRLTAEDVIRFLSQEAVEHAELASWSETLRQRWASSFMSLLRSVGMLEPLPGNRLQVPVMRVEAFTFLLLGLLGNGLSPGEALAHPLWDWYLLSEPGKEALLAEAQGRGWLHYARAADIVELQPRYCSLEAWLHADLG
jgi:hypothetical protein